MLEGDGSRGAAEVAENSLPSAISAPPRARPFAAPQLKTSVSWPANAGHPVWFCTVLEGDGSRGAAEDAEKSLPSAISAPPRANLFVGHRRDRGLSHHSAPV